MKHNDGFSSHYAKLMKITILHNLKSELNTAMRFRLLTLSGFFLAHLTAWAQPCDTTALVNFSVRASDTDPNISFEIAKHQGWINPDCTPRNLLLVHFPGTWGNPTNSLEFPALAANNGFHALGLHYINNVPASVCSNNPDIDCHRKFRTEVITGQSVSTLVTVDSINSIENRLLRYLEYLDTDRPGENWGQYIDNGAIKWDQIIVSGHSQGGGHAAFIAKNHRVHRSLMFASPNEYSTFFNAPGSWISDVSATPDSCYYGFGNLYDGNAPFTGQYAVWTGLGMANYGDTVLAENTTYPFANSRMIYNRDTTATGIAPFHSNMVIDGALPRNPDGTPWWIEEWLYMLGVANPTAINESTHNTLATYPNPSRGQITLALPTGQHTLQLIDQSGRLVREWTTIGGGVSRHNLTDLAAGHYWLKAISRDGKQFQSQIILSR